MPFLPSCRRFLERLTQTGDKKSESICDIHVKYIIWLFLFKFAGFVRGCDKIGHFPLNSPEETDLIRIDWFGNEIA